MIINMRTFSIKNKNYGLDYDSRWEEYADYQVDEFTKLLKSSGYKIKIGSTRGYNLIYANKNSNRIEIKIPYSSDNDGIIFIKFNDINYSGVEADVFEWLNDRLESHIS